MKGERIAVSRGTRALMSVITILYSGRIPMNIDCEGQIDR